MDLNANGHGEAAATLLSEADLEPVLLVYHTYHSSSQHNRASSNEFYQFLNLPYQVPLVAALLCAGNL